MAVATPAALRPGGPFVRRAIAAEPRPFRRRLPIPSEITTADIRLPMVEAEVPVLPGRPTRMWTYGGEFPGPTIRRPTGTTTRATFEHRLPGEAGDLTVHLHGGHNRSSEDGQPGGLTGELRRALYCDISPGLSARESGNELLIPPGGERTYTYETVEDGGPERAATHWYHDHRLERTARNVWRGLAGLWIAEDDFDLSLPLPRGEREIPLVIADRSFDRRNRLTDPFSAVAGAPNDGVTGRFALVNGAVLPRHKVHACRHRLRVLNASSFRSYDLVMDGARMVQIGTDAGLMPRPLRRRRILLGPGERVDLVVDFGRSANRDVVLRSVARPGDSKPLGRKTWNGALMQFRVGRRIPDSTSIPAALRPIPVWVVEARGEFDKEWRVSISTGSLRPRWLINGRAFDPSFVEHSPRLGTVETWRLVNKTKVPHLMHPHHTDWYMLSRNGRRPPPHEACLKETFFLDPGEFVTIAGRFSDYAGKYVLHCHMLDHEDHGLMSQFETVA